MAVSHSQEMATRKDGAMRGRYIAAIWLFAALALSLLAVGARAPKTRDSARHKAARMRLERLAAEVAPIAEDASIRPASGCLRDRSTGVVYFQDAQRGWVGSVLGGSQTTASSVEITPSCEAGDPSGRDFAFAELSRRLRDQWQRQGAGQLEPTTIVFVSAEPRTTFCWARWQTLLAPDLAAQVDRLNRLADDVWATVAQQWLCWEKSLRISAAPDVPRTVPADQAVRLEPTRFELAEREEHSILVRSSSELAGRDWRPAMEFAEREEQSILIQR
jgi:hypothetical protein